MGLDSVEIVVETEKRLGIEILNTDAEKAGTVQQLYDCAWKYVEEKQSVDSSVKKRSKKEVEEIILQVISEVCGLDKAEITPEKSFTKDLGID